MEWRSSHLRVWRNSDREPARELDSDPLAGLEPAERRARADELAMRETWRRFSSRHRTTDLEPFSREWFEFIDSRRYLRHASWIPRLFEFAKHPGERVLVYGDGLATDAVRYAANGAKVAVCAPSRDELHWSRINFALRELPATFHACAPDAFPSISETVDIVAIGCFEHLSAPSDDLFDEAWRVLRPGGKLIAAVPARRESGIRAAILRKGLDRFEIRRLGKRHLRRSDLPGYLRWAYFPVLEHLLGRVYVVKAIKPIRAALTLVQPRAA